MLLLSTQTTVVIASVAVFLGVIVLLVAILLFAKKKLTPSGEVNIKINEGEREIVTEPGNTLLSTLSNNKILLPSACGGGGTCAMCRCQILEGGGSILPTETDFFTRKEQNEKWRLACQVKVKEDLTIQIPQEVLGVKKWECEVVSNKNVATFIKEFVVKLPEGETLNFKSGGYIQIDVPKIEVDFKDIHVDEKFRDEWEKFGMFDLKMKNPEPTFRAYSMANHPAEGNIIMLNIRIATPP
jgi:Na+-transporting NADH:ubiquinone oxidoreductase subunit F